MRKSNKIVKNEEVFGRDDCNNKDMADSGIRKRRQKSKEPENARPSIISTQFLPSSMKKLRACIYCRLVLNR